jgi:hypothetical protein
MDLCQGIGISFEAVPAKVSGLFVLLLAQHRAKSASNIFKSLERKSALL